jgi:tetratricopeptide (TPR) repeat protein
MVDEATTWGALLDRRRDVSFIGREQALSDFRLNMVHEVPPALLFFVLGPAGIGKSALLSRYRALAQEHGFLTARVDAAQAIADPENAVLTTMDAIASQFADQGTPLTTFCEQYADYLDALDAIAEDPQAPALPLDWFEGVQVEGDFYQRFWTPYLATRFSARLLPVLRQPVQSLTSVFVSDLNAWASIRDLVLFFDDWQALGPMIESWLIDLLQEGELHVNVWLVIADVEPPGGAWQALSPVMQTQPLEPLRERDVRAYGQAHPAVGGDQVTEAYATTRGVPLLLDLWAEIGSPVLQGDPVVDAYLGSLEGLPREAVLQSAAARRLSTPVMTALLGDHGENALAWLVRSPLTVTQGDALVYHARVREGVRAWAQRTQPEGWTSAHARLGAYYENLEEDAFERGRGKHAKRRVRTREMLYHQLVAGGTEGHVQAQQAFLDALRADYRWAAEVVAIWQAAAVTPGVSDAVTAWASKLARGWEALQARDWTSALAFCDEILGDESLSEALQPGYRQLRNWIAGRLGLPLEEEEEAVEAPEVSELETEEAQDLVGATGLEASVAAEPSQTPPASLPDASADAPPDQETEPAAEDEEMPKSLSSPEDAAGAPPSPSEAEPSAPPESEAPEDQEEPESELVEDRMVAKSQATCERANALFKEGDYLGAVQIYSRAIDQDPGSISAHFNRGVTHLKLNEVAAAIDDFSQVLSLDPDNASAHYQRGMAYVRREDLTRAIEDFDAALALMPESAALYAQRASAYYQLQAYQRALDDYTRALDLRPTDITLMLNRGLTYLASGDIEQAIADYDRAIEHAPDGALAYYYRGQAHMQQGDERQALADFEQALRLEPDNAQIHTGLGMAHARMLDFEQALDAYERAMALDSENARIYYNAACAAALSEKEDQALAWLEKATALRSQYRIMARQDPDFSFIRDHPAFRRLTSEGDRSG